jgi:hypothetical protein
MPDASGAWPQEAPKRASKDEDVEQDRADGRRQACSAPTFMGKGRPAVTGSGHRRRDKLPFSGYNFCVRKVAASRRRDGDRAGGDEAMRLMLILLACAGLSGCAAAALPFRTAADAARLVPIVGDVAAVPLDAVGEVID